MDKLKDELPTSGKHPDDNAGSFETGTNVSAQNPPDPSKSSQPKPSEESPGDKSEAPKYQLLHDEQSGHYRVRALGDEVRDPEEGFKEVKQFDTRPSFDDASSDLPEGPRYVVFENSETGEVFLDLESNVTDNWSDDDRFDQITIFDSEDEANAYVEKRQDKHD